MSPALIEGIGSLAAIITTLCWVPQAIRVIRTRETRAISLVAQVSLLVGIALWLVYGVLLGSQPLIWANIVTFVLVGTIVVLKVRYG